MKKYIAPKMKMVNLRLEERMAGSLCTGQCSENVEYDGWKFYAGQNQK